MAKRNYMNGTEFVRKVLSGEKDFQSITLEEDFDLSGYEGFKELEDYLIRANLEESPLLMNNSEFIGIKAKGIYLPNTHGLHTNFRNSDFENAILRNAYMENANFRDSNLTKIEIENANFRNSDFENANLWYAYAEYTDFTNTELMNTNLEDANFSNTDLWRANFKNTELRNTDLKGAYLIGVRNLEHSLNLEHAKLYQTKVTPKEYRIIQEKLMENKQLIIV